MNQPKPIIQPGQIRLECDHQQDPRGNDPLQPVTAHTGQTVAVIGGLTCREEIASRILAAMVANRGPGLSLSHVDDALEITDALIAKTR